MIEVPHLTLGANKCEVEPHRRGGCQVLGSEPNIADVRLAADLQSQDIGHTHLVEEMRVGWLVIDFNHPAIFITANPEYSIARHLPTSNKHISSFFTHLMTKGSSRSMLVPSPSVPNISPVTLSRTDHLLTTSAFTSNSTWRASSIPSAGNITFNIFLLFYGGNYKTSYLLMK